MTARQCLSSGIRTLPSRSKTRNHGEICSNKMPTAVLRSLVAANSWQGEKPHLENEHPRRRKGTLNDCTWKPQNGISFSEKTWKPSYGIKFSPTSALQSADASPVSRIRIKRVKERIPGPLSASQILAGATDAESRSHSKKWTPQSGRQSQVFTSQKFSPPPVFEPSDPRDLKVSYEDIALSYDPTTHPLHSTLLSFNKRHFGERLGKMAERDIYHDPMLDQLNDSRKLMQDFKLITNECVYRYSQLKKLTAAFAFDIRLQDIAQPLSDLFGALEADLERVKHDYHDVLRHRLANESSQIFSDLETSRKIVHGSMMKLILRMKMDTTNARDQFKQLFSIDKLKKEFADKDLPLAEYSAAFEVANMLGRSEFLIAQIAQLAREHWKFFRKTGKAFTSPISHRLHALEEDLTEAAFLWRINSLEFTRWENSVKNAITDGSIRSDFGYHLLDCCQSSLPSFRDPHAGLSVYSTLLKTAADGLAKDGYESSLSLAIRRLFSTHTELITLQSTYNYASMLYSVELGMRRTLRRRTDELTGQIDWMKPDFWIRYPKTWVGYILSKFESMVAVRTFEKDIDECFSLLGPNASFWIREFEMSRVYKQKTSELYYLNNRHRPSFKTYGKKNHLRRKAALEREMIKAERHLEQHQFFVTTEKAVTQTLNFSQTAARQSYETFAFSSSNSSQEIPISTFKISSKTTDSDREPEASPANVTEETISAPENQNAVHQHSSLDTGLSFKISNEALRKAMESPITSGDHFWQYGLYRGPNQEQVKVHYCRTKETTERIAQLFLEEEVIGFDLEWKPNCTVRGGARSNVSLIQVASPDRIALFHLAVFPKSQNEPADLVADSLKKLLESPSVTKVGVAIKGDCTRLRRHLSIESQGLFELSHLYKLIKYSDTDPAKINKALIPLATMVKEHLHLPMWKGEVRGSDWSKRLDYEQITYAASDAYAGPHLYAVMEAKRRQLSPSPPRPAHAELNLPIRLANGGVVTSSRNPQYLAVSESESSSNSLLDDESMEESDELSEEESDAMSDVRSDVSLSQMSSQEEILEVSMQTTIIQDEDEGVEKEQRVMTKVSRTLASRNAPAKPEVIVAEEWVTNWKMTRSRKPKASMPCLRAYALWHRDGRNVEECAALLRDPPLQKSTVVTYILEAVRLERLEYDPDRLKELISLLPSSVFESRYKGFKRLLSL